MGKEWYQKGTEAGTERSKQIQKDRDSMFGESRTWLKPGTDGKFTYLDDLEFFFLEHNLKIRGRWGNYYTCRRDFDECPLCESGDNPSYVGVCTVIDHRTIDRKDKPSEKDVRRLMVVKNKVITKLARKQKEKGGLRLVILQHARDSKEECATGEDLTVIGKAKSEKSYQKMVPPKTTLDEFLKPFDYEELFAPKSVEELRKIAGFGAPAGSDEVADVGDDVVGGDEDLEALL